MSRHHLILGLLAASLIVLFFFINIASIDYVGPYAWDDGAITLAYGKTLALHGRFSLNAASEIVEGTSSALFSLLAALYTFVARPDFYELITFSQVASFVFAAIAVVLLYRIINKYFSSKYHSLLVAVLAGCMPMFTTEVMNGMEMTLLALLFLWLIYLHEKRSKLVFVVIPLLLLCRFESIYYIIFSYGMLLLFDRQRKVEHFRILCYSIFIFALFTAARYLYFGEAIPNTIYAKMNPPYTPQEIHAIFRMKLNGGKDFILTYMFLLAGCIFPMINSRIRKAVAVSLPFWLVLAFFSFALIAGRNWGYHQRMALACLPVLVVLLAQCADFYKHQLAVLFVCLFGTILANRNLYVENANLAFAGAYYQNKIPPGALLGRAEEMFTKSPFWFDITPENYRLTGLAVDSLRAALDYNIIKLLVPDVGGLGLCCDRIKVIDSSLLTNRYLARNGYAHFEQQLADEMPDVIETHGIWSRVTGIYNSPAFRSNYLPLIVRNNLFWVRKEAMSELVDKGVKLPGISVDQLPPDIRYLQYPIDQEYLLNSYRGYIYILPDAFDEQRS